jgi:hypothetical protein
MMTQLYVRYDSETNSISAGPQAGMQDQSGWYAYLPAHDRLDREEVDYFVDDEKGTVMQYVTGSTPEPEYTESRAVNYPKITEQLDKLFHDIESGTLNETGEFYTAIKAVKDEYPKAQ